MKESTNAATSSDGIVEHTLVMVDNGYEAHYQENHEHYKLLQIVFACDFFRCYVLTPINNNGVDCFVLLLFLVYHLVMKLLGKIGARVVAAGDGFVIEDCAARVTTSGIFFGLARQQKKQ